MMNYFKRRFSQGDLNGELEDDRESVESVLNKINAENILSKPMQAMFNRKPASPSVPSSPTKSLSISTMMSVAKDILGNQAQPQSQPAQAQQGQSQQQQQQAQRAPLTHQTSQSQTSNFTQIQPKERARILLVIDDPRVNWAQYFRNRKINNIDLRVEQAEFKDINLASYSDVGCIVDLMVDKNGSKVMRSFKPDFVLVRQHGRTSETNWRNVIIGLQHGGVPSTNSLNVVYNFMDKPWVFAQLIQIQKKHGADKFPLINQTYYPNYQEMMRSSFPCIVKVGHAHQGLGKIKVENALDFQDLASIVSISDSYSTSEPYIQSKCDIQIQKIGQTYKAYMRKSITGNWKTNTGSAMLEQIPMNDKYKFWLDEVSQLFDGMDVCALQLIVEQETGKEFIIDMCDSAFSLLGEQQEVDRRVMADLVYDKMAKIYTNSNLSESKATPNPSNPTRAKIQSQHSINKEDELMFNMSRKNSAFNSNHSIKDSTNPQLPNPSLPSQASNVTTSISQSSSVSSNVSHSTRSTAAPQPPQLPERPKTPPKAPLGPAPVPPPHTTPAQSQPVHPAPPPVPPPIPPHQPKIVPANPNDTKLREQEDFSKVNVQTTRVPQAQQVAPSKPNGPPSRMNTLPSIPNTNAKAGPVMTTSSSTIGQTAPAVPNRPLSNASSVTNKPLSGTNATGGLFSSQSGKSNENKSSDEPEDTMNNLRKTFAGIFGNSSLI